MKQPISILLCALGGEGGGVLAKWLVDASRIGGYPVQATSIPGVAQRTGATTYYLELFPILETELAGKRPVLGLNPLPGRIDLLVSSELMETARQITNGMSASDRTVLVSSNNRVLTTLEKIQLGDGRVEADELVQLIAANCKASHLLDMDALTKQAGTVVSSIMLGCIAASGVLPLKREDYEAAIDADGASASQKASLRGFALAWDALLQKKLATQKLEIPEPDMKALGIARLIEYQDDRYADLYVQRLKKIEAAVQGASTPADITNETARWLALWMAFDDIVRVADLKSRASRMTRVRSEVKAQSDELVKVFDFFKPGVPEFAGMLPEGLSNRLLKWEQARVRRGLAPLEFPIKVSSHSVFGFLMLRTLASMKWLRVRGTRYGREQEAIEEWLAAIVAATEQHASLGLAVARCGQLIKGYGSTNARGHENWLHILRHLVQGVPFASPEARALAVDQAREAALRDEAGTELDVALRAHGAPKREIKSQSIKWMPRPVDAR